MPASVKLTVSERVNDFMVMDNPPRVRHYREDVEPGNAGEVVHLRG